MKIYAITDNHNKEIIRIHSNNRLNALRNYRKGLSTSGMYWIEKKNGNYYLCSSFGMNYSVHEII